MGNAMACMKKSDPEWGVVEMEEGKVATKGPKGQIDRIRARQLTSWMSKLKDEEGFSKTFADWRLFFEPGKVRREEKKASKKASKAAKKKKKAAERKKKGKEHEESMLMLTVLGKFSKKVSKAMVQLLIEEVVKILDVVVDELRNSEPREISGEEIDLKLLGRFISSSSGLLKMIRFDGKGPGPPPIRARRTATFKDHFGGQMAFAIADIIDTTSTLSKVARAATTANSVADGAAKVSDTAASLVDAATRTAERASRTLSAPPPDALALPQEGGDLARSHSYRNAVPDERGSAAAPAPSLDLGLQASKPADARGSVTSGGAPAPENAVEAVIVAVSSKLAELLDRKKSEITRGMGGRGLFSMLEQSGAMEAAGAEGEAVAHAVEAGLTLFMSQLTQVVQAQLNPEKVIQQVCKIAGDLFRAVEHTRDGAARASQAAATSAERATAAAKYVEEINDRGHHEAKRTIVDTVDRELAEARKYIENAMVTALTSLLHFCDEIDGEDEDADKHDDEA